MYTKGTKIFQSVECLLQKRQILGSNIQFLISIQAYCQIANMQFVSPVIQSKVQSLCNKRSSGGHVIWLVNFRLLNLGMLILKKIIQEITPNNVKINFISQYGLIKNIFFITQETKNQEYKIMAKKAKFTNYQGRGEGSLT